MKQLYRLRTVATPAGVHVQWCAALCTCRGALPYRSVSADKLGMEKRLSLGEVLDKYRLICPRCRCNEAIVLIDIAFEVTWQCVDCETRWPASDAERELLLGPSLKMIH